ncbi:NADPH oxidase 5-like [Centruroides sculpturatus]|uniref:NADPH oxidase 5-like n=1 Tax=Centruroides sculpturatus TaxID=218467 RepID=UPI000C6E106A|nr:NADPH oxidase 5-like [Centruroides sculpturatus]XP_023229648.1 NADPH oxidase 5-like [Centruroides sculpturatus]XP_023229649.1 NADPH oxidase 5-like [Centruroides sculpturatus]
MEFITSIRQSSVKEKQGLTPSNLKHLEDVFKQVVGDHEEICVAQFKRIVKSNNKFFVERIFKLFDTDKSGSISLEEFMTAMRSFAELTSVEKLHWLFQIYDIDGDGLIQFSELRSVMKACMEENELHFSDAGLDELTMMLFESADTDHSGSINFEKFQAQLKRHPGLSENLTMSIESWLLPRKLNERSVDAKKFIPRKLKWDYIKNNGVSVVFFLLFVIVNVALFAKAAYDYKHTNGFVMVARGCGQCLNFTSVFILVLMLRYSITWLRSNGFSEYLPLDQHIYFHKLTGCLIFVYSVVHTIMHICNFDTLSRQTNYTLTEFLFDTSPNIGWVGGGASITGWVLLVTLIIMVVAALPFVRRNGNFEIFYYTHLLYIVYWVVLIFHGPNFWKWFVGPAALFLLELSVKLYRKMITNRRAYIYKGVLLPSKVIQLIIKRPPNFYYKPGDYVFINIPQIALYEWHPFTISSAPEIDDIISIHIRVAGGWTNELYKYFKEEEKWAVPVHSTTESTFTEVSSSHVNPSFQNDPDDNFEEIKLKEKTQRSLSAEKTIQITDLDESTSKEVLRRHHSIPNTFWKRHSRNNSRNSIRISTARRSFRQCESIIIMPVVEELDPSSEAENGRVSKPGKREENLTDDNVIVSQCPLKISIDGPYGSPSNHIFEAEHAVLIATGIGVTPFASILQSIMHRHRNTVHECPKCQHSFHDNTSFTGMRLRKVDFFWINRDQRCFEWFVTLLSQLEIDEVKTQCKGERFLDIHMYITSALRKTDMKAVGLQMALDLLHSKEERCLITGLKTRTQPGRPDWNNVFHDIFARKKGKVTVFFCGPTILGKTIHQKCNEFNFCFRKEVF